MVWLISKWFKDMQRVQADRQTSRQHREVFQIGKRVDRFKDLQWDRQIDRQVGCLARQADRQVGDKV